MLISIKNYFLLLVAVALYFSIAASGIASQITGRVTAHSGGAPLKEIAVTAYLWNGEYWDYIEEAMTDVNGFYELEELSAGTYRIE